MMPQDFGMICLIMYAKSLSSFRKKLKTYLFCKSIPTPVFWSCSFSMALSLVMFFGLMIMDLCFLVLYALESVNRWRLTTMKVLLELEQYNFLYTF